MYVSVYVCMYVCMHARTCVRMYKVCKLLIHTMHVIRTPGNKINLIP
jgi:hypothetical protein